MWGVIIQMPQLLFIVKRSQSLSGPQCCHSLVSNLGFIRKLSLHILKAIRLRLKRCAPIVVPFLPTPEGTVIELAFEKCSSVSLPKGL